jgi:hypothetical protein
MTPQMKDAVHHHHHHHTRLRAVAQWLRNGASGRRLGGRVIKLTTHCTTNYAYCLLSLACRQHAIETDNLWMQWRKCKSKGNKGKRSFWDMRRTPLPVQGQCERYEFGNSEHD